MRFKGSVRAWVGFGLAIGIRHAGMALGVALGTGLFLQSVSAADVTPTRWTENGSGDFLAPDNWDNGVPGNSANDGEFLIDNGGTAQLSGSNQAVTGILGRLAGGTGSLTILSGGNLQVVRQQGGFGYAGEFYAGQAGSGTVRIAEGGQLSAYNFFVGGDAGAAGTVTIQGGSLTMDSLFTIGDAGTGNVSIANTLTHDAGVSNQNATLGNAANSSGTVTLTSGSWANSQALTVGGAGSGTVTVGAAGTLTSATATLGATAGGSGEMTVDGGSWTNSGEFTVGSNGHGTLTISNGGTVAVGGNAILSAGTTGSSSVTVNDGNWTVDEFLTIGQNAAGSVTVNAAGTLTADAIFVSADSDNAESTLAINGGTVVAGQIAGLANGAVTFTNGTFRFTQDNPGVFAGFSDGDVTLNGTAVTFDTQQYHVATGIALDGTARLIKTGGGRLGLNGANSYSGGTYLQTGEILINNNASIGSGSLEMDTAELRSTATVELAVPKIQVNANHVAAFSTAADTTFTLGAADFELGADAMFRIGSAGNTGTVVFDVDEAISLAPGTGTISVGFGTLRAGNGQLAALAAQVGKVFIVDGATLDFNDQLAGGKIRTLEGEGTLRIGSSAATELRIESGDFRGEITGAGSVIKEGTGELILTEAQSYTGGTTVTDGTLTVSGATGDVAINGGTLNVIGSADIITVNAGGRLQGTGAVEGIALNGGVIAPGESPGTLNALSMEWLSGVLEFELGPSALLSDHLALSGILDGAGGVYQFHFLDEGAVRGMTYDLISFQSSTLAINDFSLTNMDGFDGDFFYQGNVLKFTITALPIPEPGTIGLLGLALAALWARSRRRG